jgi:two-component system nitrogen regulation response regulator GlnG
MPDINRAQMTCPEVILGELSGGQRSVLRVTIVFHPSLDRVGETCDLDVLAGEEVNLSRLSPLFSAPRSNKAAPLADSYISRKPITLQWCNAELLLNIPAAGSSLLLGGERVADSCRISGHRIRQGLVLVLARRVVLHLQLDQPHAVQPDLCGLVGESNVLQKLRAQICQLALSDAPVLLLGESGSGKELVARAIHRRSLRQDVDMLAINMAAIPTELAASELFGAGRGAYTGADRKKAGYFQCADGGTLFMDEIGETPVAVQPQLLRALESGEVQPAGGGICTVDVRIISATDAELDHGGERFFSTALRHRLGALELRLPSLAERRDDIGRLLFHFLSCFEGDSGVPGRVQQGLSDPTVAAQWALLLSSMAMYDWPGNVRELRNYCGQIALATASADKLSLPDNILRTLAANPQRSASEPEATGVRESLPNDPSEHRRYRAASVLDDEEVHAAMSAAVWEVAAAARELNVSRPALYKRLERIPTIRLASDIPVAELQEAWHRCGGEVERAVALLEVSRTALQQRWRALDLL